MKEYLLCSCFKEEESERGLSLLFPDKVSRCDKGERPAI